MVYLIVGGVQPEFSKRKAGEDEIEESSSKKVKLIVELTQGSRTRKRGMRARETGRGLSNWGGREEELDTVDLHPWDESRRRVDGVKETIPTPVAVPSQSLFEMLHVKRKYYTSITRCGQTCRLGREIYSARSTAYSKIPSDVL
jgi:hypothetical protein